MYTAVVIISNPVHYPTRDQLRRLGLLKQLGNSSYLVHTEDSEDSDSLLYMQASAFLAGS